MRYELKIEPETGCACVNVSGPIGLDDFVGMLDELWSNNEYKICRHVIWDFSNCETSFFFDDVVRLKEFILKAKQGRGPTIFALVAANDREYGMCRSFQILGSLAGFTINVFRAEDHARVWLTEQCNSTPLGQ